ncbi:MAG: hypothetical protein ACRESZ_12455 [Methylococcales bacterium]
MKHVLFLALIIAFVNVGAQETSPAEEFPKPKMRMPPMATRTAYSAESQTGDAQIINLLKAQSEAIKSLSSKLNSLEERLDKMEK